jgi:hypothetical protein
VITGKKTNKSGKRFVIGLVSLLIIISISISPLLSDVEMKSDNSKGMGVSEQVDDHTDHQDSN